MTPLLVQISGSGPPRTAQAPVIPRCSSSKSCGLPSPGSCQACWPGSSASLRSSCLIRAAWRPERSCAAARSACREAVVTRTLPGGQAPAGRRWRGVGSGGRGTGGGRCGRLLPGGAETIEAGHCWLPRQGGHGRGAAWLVPGRRRIARISAWVRIQAGRCARPCTAALYRRCVPSLWPAFGNCPVSNLHDTLPQRCSRHLQAAMPARCFTPLRAIQQQMTAMLLGWHPTLFLGKSQN